MVGGLHWMGGTQDGRASVEWFRHGNGIVAWNTHESAWIKGETNDDSFRGTEEFGWREDKREGGVADGTRTHDDRNHNPGLYQLSYGHHCDTTCNFRC